MEHIYPDFFARYYDLIYDQVRGDTDLRFYLDRIRQVKGKVLEAGCGTGRLLCRALAGGADIHGIDISPAMLEVLKTKIPGGQHYRASLQSITDFRFSFSFSLILAPFRTFMHLVSIEDQLSALRNVHSFLDDGGVFVFDAFVPDLNIITNGIQDLKDFETEAETGITLRRIINSRGELNEQLIHVNFRFESDDGQNVRVQEWDSGLRFFFRWEIEHLLARSPFTKWELLGDFSGRPFQTDSREFIVVCHK